MKREREGYLETDAKSINQKNSKKNINSEASYNEEEV